jgi:hypothetical protein
MSYGLHVADRQERYTESSRNLGLRSEDRHEVFVMDEKESRSAFMSALTTEHFVLQTAANATVSEAAARSSLYVFSLSSSLVAMGFTSQSPEVFVPFVATVLPALFLLGVFTVVRLVDTTIENMRALTGIARIRGYYRTLTPDGAVYFAAAHGRWPEGHSDPALRLGPLVAFFTTSASMIAFINCIVAGTGVTLLAADFLPGGRTVLALALGLAAAVVFLAVFLAYQRSCFRIFELAESHQGARKGSGE